MKLAADDALGEPKRPVLTLQVFDHACQLLTQCIAAQPLSLLCLLDPEGLCRLAGFLGTLGLFPCGDGLALPLLGCLLGLAGGFGGGKSGLLAALRFGLFPGAALYLGSFAGLTLGLRTLGGFSGLATLSINGLMCFALFRV